MTSEVLGWVQKLLRQQSVFPGLEAKNFMSSFADGRVFASLLSLVDTDKQPRKTRPGGGTRDELLAYLDETFDRFLQLGVPRLLDAGDMIPAPEKLSIATYCIEMRRRWDGLAAQSGIEPAVAGGAAAVHAAAVSSSDKENALSAKVSQLQQAAAQMQREVEEKENRWRQERNRAEESGARLRDKTDECEQLSRQLARAGSGSGLSVVSTQSSIATSLKFFVAGIVVGAGLALWWMMK
jgi:hypothetical protein